ncbi:hypothetical protein GDO86_003779 [Hymenochirus boettgeri]|uniref:Tyrosine-protein phosphatase domain-containing protein n=1 Tax=Hymenochirus boettgeri TaxID=247094 RepID=A0A8T2K6D6_9PIPI|nr:hypothetical protein GDO86_003779 [Hymenochirus boettgeri]
MANLVLCKPTELYNILNQSTKFSRLAEPNYLCLLGKFYARSKREYNEGHILTARKTKQDEDGNFLLPESIELDCVRYCVVYDGNTASLDSDSPAVECAKVMAKICHNPVTVLKGGYELFSANYHFFRSQKVFWMPQEIDDFQPYPIEIIPGLFYLGDQRQAWDRHIRKDLKIRAHVNVSLDQEKEHISEIHNELHVPVEDSCESDLLQYFFNSCQFIDAQMSQNSTVLVSSKLGISRSSTVVMAYLMYHKQYSLKEAWMHVLKCKPNMRPNRGFVMQLSEWENRVMGQQSTDVSDPNF